MTDDEKEAFSSALIGYLPALRRYARGLTGQAAAADDLVQGCIEKALMEFSTLKDVKRIGGWLRKILHNLYIDELRRTRRRGFQADLTAIERAGELTAPPRDQNVSIDLARAMARLTFEHRQVVLLVGVEGLSYREVAEELSVPLGTVMSRLARARDRLRMELDMDRASRNSHGPEKDGSGMDHD